MKKSIIIGLLLTLCSCQSQDKKEEVFTSKAFKTEAIKSTDLIKEKQLMKFEVIKSEQEWKSKLSSEEYHVLREKGTERPYTGVYDKHFEKGYYACAACENPLFTSDTKFDSHCGWPSFDAAIKGAVIYEKDHSYGMQRVEVMCAKCGGHLGHVFDDGPTETTGMRYCTNSISIKFIPEK